MKSYLFLAKRKLNMQVKMYAILDKVVGAYQAPLFFHNDDVAKRAFMSALRSSPEMQEHCNDYDLYYLADWDDNTGEIHPVQPLVICRLAELMSQIPDVKQLSLVDTIEQSAPTMV